MLVVVSNIRQQFPSRMAKLAHYKKKRIRQRFKYVVNHIQQWGPARCWCWCCWMSMTFDNGQFTLQNATLPVIICHVTTLYFRSWCLTFLHFSPQTFWCCHFLYNNNTCSLLFVTFNNNSVLVAVFNIQQQYMLVVVSNIRQQWMLVASCNILDN